MSRRAWKQHKIQVRAKELLEKYPHKKMIPFGIMIRDVIAVKREMNWIKRKSHR